MTAYYNEIDPYAAQWLRNLVAENLIAEGEVDDRSITEVQPGDLAGFDQCHFFAGIGGWSLALRLAGWPDGRPVWTGSCPCQPFSAAGKRAGFGDARHLWPAWFRLIAQCRPATVFGEQVASADADRWIDLVQDDLEGLGYAVGAVPLPAAGIGAPHIRDRLWWIAGLGGSGRLAAADREQHQRGGHIGAPRRDEHSDGGAACGLADADCNVGGGGGYGAAGTAPGGMQAAHGQRQRIWADARPGGGALDGAPRSGALDGFWRAADWLLCRDGKWRPVERGTQPLADGVPGRVGRLRAYGNAIVPQVAAEFIKAYVS